MFSLALSSWTWLVVAGFSFFSLALLILVALRLIAALKGLSGTLSDRSGEIQAAMGTMRDELDQAAERLAVIRERSEKDPAGPAN